MIAINLIEPQWFRFAWLNGANWSLIDGPYADHWYWFSSRLDEACSYQNDFGKERKIVDLTSKFSLESEAIDLADSWINGNRSYVLSELTKYGRREATIAYLAIAAYNRIPKDDREIFTTMIYNRI